MSKELQERSGPVNLCWKVRVNHVRGNCRIDSAHIVYDTNFGFNANFNYFTKLKDL
jgi:hypothetical protein